MTIFLLYTGCYPLYFQVNRTAVIWNDPRRQERYDHVHSRRDEDRWQTIGMSRFGVLMVVYTDKVHDSESDIRVISARKAERYEAKQYFNMTYGMMGVAR